MYTLWCGTTVVPAAINMKYIYHWSTDISCFKPRSFCFRTLHYNGKRENSEHMYFVCIFWPIYDLCAFIIFILLMVEQGINCLKCKKCYFTFLCDVLLMHLNIHTNKIWSKLWCHFLRCQASLTVFQSSDFTTFMYKFSKQTSLKGILYI